MTRRAVEDGFERYLSDLVDETYAAFDVAAVLRGSRSGGSRAVSKLLKNSRPLERHVVRPKLREYQREITRQFEPVLDYAADEESPFEAYTDEILARDIYWESLADDVTREQRETIEERLLARQRSFGDDIAPLIETDSDDFWTAVQSVYDRQEATELVETHFEYSTPLQDHRDAFVFELEIDPGEVLGGLARALPSLDVEFTDEALRAMRRAERTVLPQAKRDLERAYSEE